MVLEPGRHARLTNRGSTRLPFPKNGRWETGRENARNDPRLTYEHPAPGPGTLDP